MAFRQDEVIVPVLNWNGTSADDLIEQYTNAVTALDAALTALQETRPHGRDYQTEEPHVYHEARAQHQQRVKLLAVLHRDVDGILSSLHSQAHRQVQRGK